MLIRIDKRVRVPDINYKFWKIFYVLKQIEKMSDLIDVICLRCHMNRDLNIIVFFKEKTCIISVDVC